MGSAGQTVECRRGDHQIDKKNVQGVDPVDSAFNVATGQVRSRGFDLNVAGNLTPE